MNEIIPIWFAGFTGAVLPEIYDLKRMMKEEIEVYQDGYSDQIVSKKSSIDLRGRLLMYLMYTLYGALYGALGGFVPLFLGIYTLQGAFYTGLSLPILIEKVKSRFDITSIL